MWMIILSDMKFKLKI